MQKRVVLKILANLYMERRDPLTIKTIATVSEKSTKIPVFFLR
jgi:hypothetical protein